jgi:hypothetical protein
MKIKLSINARERHMRHEKQKKIGGGKGYINVVAPGQIWSFGIDRVVVPES